LASISEGVPQLCECLYRVPRGYCGRRAILLVAWVAAFAVIRGVMDIVLAFRFRALQRAFGSRLKIWVRGDGHQEGSRTVQEAD
jgi:hypothetical protein